MDPNNKYSPLNVSDKRASISNLLDTDNKPSKLVEIEKIINIVFKVIIAITLIVFVIYLIASFYIIGSQVITIGTNINNNVNYFHNIIVEHNKTVVDLEIKLDKLIIVINQYLAKLNHTVNAF